MKSVVIADHRPGGGRPPREPGVPALRRALGLPDPRLPAVSREDQGEGRAGPSAICATNFLYGRTFLGDADLADQCAHWLTDVANQRVHGTTHELPALRFARDEQAALQPLAARPYRSLLLSIPLPPARVARSRTPPIEVERRDLASYSNARRGGRLMAAPTLRDRLRTQLADLKMPRALEAPG